MSEQSWFYPRGALAREEWESVVDDRIPGWKHAGLRVRELRAGVPVILEASDRERMFVPLQGGAALRWASPTGEGELILRGRRSVFDGPTDVAFVGSQTSVEVEGTGRLAIAEAVATSERPVAYLPREDVPVELRGAGRSTRQVHNFGVPGALDADSLIVCEVITPSENWSSYPAHKHDELIPGVESKLEEIYYFEAEVSSDPAARSATGASADGASLGAGSVGGAEPFGMFAAYSSPQGEIAINALVHTGDIALVPHGYHGPAAAAPGYDLYYLNVMAGPAVEREWRITDDPHQSWVRDLWAGQPVDPRLPYGAAKEQTE
jgi:5-deoxy-glucuronate isomerase